MIARRWMALAGLALVVGLAAPTLAVDKSKNKVKTKDMAKAEAKDKAKTARIALGAKAPMTNVEMMGVDGKKTSIAKATGEKGTLVIFTCNACPWVKAWEERTVELGNRFLADGFGVIAINPNDPGVNEEDGFEVMKERAKKRGIEYAYVVDATSEVARAFGATRTPEVFLFDAKSKLVYHGVIDDNAHKDEEVKERYLEDAMNAVAAGKEVKVKETKALGCTIKFRKGA